MEAILKLGTTKFFLQWISVLRLKAFASVTLVPRRRLRRLFLPNYFPDVGEPERFENIPIVEYEPSPYGTHFTVNCGGPIWPDWESETHARHFRDMHRKECKPTTPPCIDESIESGVWIGPIVDCFGHFVAEYSSRLLVSKLRFPNSPFLFSVNSTSSIHHVDEAPPYFRQILRWYDIPESQVRIIRKPTCVRELSVFRDQECLNGPGPSEEYLNLLTRWAASKIGRLERQPYLFVSRVKTKSPLAGEAYLSQLLSEIGIPTYYPEDHPIQEQLEEYSRTDHLIFVEGSATIGLQLLGKIDAHITVLVKQPGKKMTELSLKNRGKSLTYVELTRDLLLQDDLQKNVGLPILDRPKLFRFLKSFDSRLLALWDGDAFQSRVRHDVERWHGFYKDVTLNQTIRAYNRFVLRRNGLEELSP